MTFWNVTFIYHAFIRTTDHCKVQTAFVSLFYIFFNMKPSLKSELVEISKLFHWKATPTRAFNEFLYDFFLISENSLKFANFLLTQRILDLWCRLRSNWRASAKVNLVRNNQCVRKQTALLSLLGTTCQVPASTRK